MAPNAAKTPWQRQLPGLGVELEPVLVTYRYHLPLYTELPAGVEL